MSGHGSPCANSRARRANHASLYLFGSAGTCPQGRNMVGISMGWARSPRARARKVKAAALVKSPGWLGRGTAGCAKTKTVN